MPDDEIPVDADDKTHAAIAASIKAGEPVIIKLRAPVKFGTRTIAEITVRPMKAKYMRAIRETDAPMAGTLAMASKLTGEVSEVIDELEGKDLRDVLQAVNGFFFAIQWSGPKSSEP